MKFMEKECNTGTKHFIGVKNVTTGQQQLFTLLDRRGIYQFEISSTQMCFRGLCVGKREGKHEARWQGGSFHLEPLVSTRKQEVQLP